MKYKTLVNIVVSSLFAFLVGCASNGGDSYIKSEMYDGLRAVWGKKNGEKFSNLMTTGQGLFSYSASKISAQDFNGDGKFSDLEINLNQVPNGHFLKKHYGNPTKMNEVYDELSQR